MAKGTPATVALEKAGIALTLHEYDYDPNAQRIGMRAAQALGARAAPQNADGKIGRRHRLPAGTLRPRGEFEETCSPVCSAPRQLPWW